MTRVVRVDRADGTPCVLKICASGEDARREAAALRAFGGRGSVTLLDYNPASATLLLTRAEPGTPLADLCYSDDERATAIAASVIRALPREVAADVPAVDEWSSDLAHFRDPLAADAAAILADLLASPSPRLLLHGDLHQFNILSAGDGWLSIDPKGIRGELECEIAPLVLNPLALLRGADLPKLLGRRMSQLCDELPLDRRRAYAWTFVCAVLAVAWAIEDEGEAPAEWVECARVLRAMTPTVWR